MSVTGYTKDGADNQFVAGRSCSTDGSFGLPEPTGKGLEFVISATGLDEIRVNGQAVVLAPGQVVIGYGTATANLYYAQNSDGTVPRLETDQSLYVGDVLLAYGDVKALGGLGINGNDPVYKTDAPTGTTDEQVAGIISTLRSLGLYS